MNDGSLKGTINKRGKHSWRVQLSLGKGPDGKYLQKRETIHGTKQDALDLLTRWNAELLDGEVTPTSYRTVQQVYDEWIEFIAEYRQPNTLDYYRYRFADILPIIGSRRIKDVSSRDLQDILRKYPSKDRHNKSALSAFFGWAIKQKIIRENPCEHLETQSRLHRKEEQQVWSIEQVRQVYAELTYENLYDIFVVIGVECGLRPQETLALTWDKIGDVITVDSAIKDRDANSAVIGETKTYRDRIVYPTAYLVDKLAIHREKQEERRRSRYYLADSQLVVADSKGHVPDLKYIRKYLYILADRLGVQRVSPKDLRSTHISILHRIGVPVGTIREQVGHSNLDMINNHYLRIYNDSLKDASKALHDELRRE